MADPAEAQLSLRASWVPIARALLAADPNPLTAPELAQAARKNSSNLKKMADDMVDAGVLRHVAPAHQPSGPGRRADTAYAFASGRRDEVKDLLASSTAPGTFRAGQQLVFADATDRSLVDLFQVLGSNPRAGQASWSALCDGDRQEYVLAFDGEDPASTAIDLMAALTAAQVRCRRTAISQVLPIDELITRARDAD